MKAKFNSWNCFLLLFAPSLCGSIASISWVHFTSLELQLTLCVLVRWDEINIRLFAHVHHQHVWWENGTVYKEKHLKPYCTIRGMDHLCWETKHFVASARRFRGSEIVYHKTMSQSDFKINTEMVKEIQPLLVFFLIMLSRFDWTDWNYWSNQYAQTS